MKAEGFVRKRIREIIESNNYGAFLQISDEDKRSLYATCITASELDWIYDGEIIDKIAKYIFSGENQDAISLGKEIKQVLSNYYDAYLEDLFEQCQQDSE